MRMIITLLTDFGTKDYYVSAMKGVIKSINPSADIVDITHEVEPFSILNGAFILWQAVSWFPRRSVHVGVVDPGVGTERKPIVIRAGETLLVGPDNGILFPAASKLSDKLEVFKIVEGKYTLRRSGTFDGRDVFAPVAAHLSKGIPVEEIGIKVDDFIKIDLFDWRRAGEVILGKILHIDRFGNIITNIPNLNVNNIVLRMKNMEIPVRIMRSYADAEDKIFLVEGSSGLLEISSRMKSAAELTGLKVGDSIELVIR
ncbi:MAG: SAM hydrolase/SAM-dependent halogenase family protein [Candidatus Methanodesulfokora sp.]|jgi:S-adenosylmethionine hydrolase